MLARLRELMARGAAPLSDLVQLVAGEMVAEVASVYVRRPGEILELAATCGLNANAVGRTRLRVGEGIVGLCAAGGRVMNLPDAQNHPAFAYRPETGEEPFASMLAVPVRRAGRTLGVLTVQNRATRRYAEADVEELETVAMLVAELLATGGADDAPEEALGGPRVFQGLSLVGGMALGPAVLHRARRVASRLLADDPTIEAERLRAAFERMQRGLDALIADTAPEGTSDGGASRDVLDAYRLVAADAGWLRRAEEKIRSGLSAEAAVARVGSELHDRMRQVSDPYLRERLADLEDLAGRLLDALEGTAHEHDRLPPGAVLMARRLGPAELLGWHARGIAAIAIEEGTPAGHAAIIARALGLPAIGNVRGAVAAAEAGEDVAVNGEEGSLILRPDNETRQVFARALAEQGERRAAWETLRARPARTRDGTRVQVMLNLGLALELAQIDATGADGVGLFRTEIPMLARGRIPGVTEQAALYARVLDTAGPLPVVFRTMDLGADKLIPGSKAPEEENPAMGWRSLRVALDRPAVLRRQIRALLLASHGRKLSIMFPMVATVAEFRAARAILLTEAARISPKPERLEIGTMLEVPALLWQLPALLEEADFISVGSNDLLQFLFAADRGTPALAGRYDLLSPPVLDLMEGLLTQAGAARDGAGVPVSVCGEAAGRPIDAITLIALGLERLSMPSTGIFPVKAALDALDLEAFRPVLAAIRRGESGGASVREPLTAWARENGIPV
jgi:phosphotransferase system enzyme I (PtsP)